MHFALAVVCAVVPATSDIESVRAWLHSEYGPGHMGRPVLMVTGATELSPDSSEFAAVRALIRACPPAAPNIGDCFSCPAPGHKDAAPNGTLYQADLDGDGMMERVFTGGCSPAPYFVALKVNGSTWTVWHSGRGFLRDVQRKKGSVVFIAATDGYGVGRDSVLRVSEVGGSSREYRVVGEQPASTAPTARDTCVASKTVKVRSTPVVNDAPTESGLGFDYPGNLVQTLARGSVGIALGRRGK